MDSNNLVTFGVSLAAVGLGLLMISSAKKEQSSQQTVLSSPPRSSSPVRRGSESRRPSGPSQQIWSILAMLQERKNQTEDGSIQIAKEEVDALVRYFSEGGKESLSRHKELLAMVYSKVSNNPELFDESFTQYIESEYLKTNMHRRGGSNRSGTVQTPHGTPKRRKNSVIYRQDSTSELFADPDLALPPDVSEEVAELLEDIKSWDFDIFRLAELTGYPLVVAGQTAIAGSGLIESLRLDTRKLRGFLHAIEEAYFVTNPYHNSIHAADALQAFYFFLEEGGLRAHLSSETALACLIGAGIHDVGHPGVTGKYLIATQDDLAITYNDKSPLENMHLATAFSLLRQDHLNFIDHFSSSHRAAFRHTLIEMVLATDNDHHFEMMKSVEEELEAFSEKVEAYERGEPIDDSGDEGDEEQTSEEQARKKLMSPLQPLLLKLTMHAADISNPAKRWDIYNHWTDRLMEEFYRQGDKERDRKMPISYAFDRENPVPRAKFQKGFLVAIVEPLYAELNRFPQIDVSMPLNLIQDNSARWQEVLEGKDIYEDDGEFTPTHEILARRREDDDEDEEEEEEEEGKQTPSISSRRPFR